VRMNRDSIEWVAVHEAAHAIALYRQIDSAGSVSIVPNRQAETLGHFQDDGSSCSTDPKDVEAHIVSCYAGGHAQRLADPSTGADGCDSDDNEAASLLAQWSWQNREQELRAKSAVLVEKHWTEIEAVARELLILRSLDATEVELIADRTAGDLEANVAVYREGFGTQLDAWRKSMEPS